MGLLIYKYGLQICFKVNKLFHQIAGVSVALKIIKTNNSNIDFVELTSQLDNDLNNRYGFKQSEYDELNKIGPIDTAVVGYIEGKPVACGCFKVLGNQTIEIKRMYVQRDHRRKGFSSEILQMLEKWASELGHSKALLETGKGQPEAIGLYVKHGYQKIKNYDPYNDQSNSLCMEKLI